jgi:hypothetical protein
MVISVYEVYDIAPAHISNVEYNSQTFNQTLNHLYTLAWHNTLSCNNKLCCIVYGFTCKVVVDPMIKQIRKCCN